MAIKGPGERHIWQAGSLLFGLLALFILGSPRVASSESSSHSFYPAAGGVPAPDHVVIVVEENHSYTEIIGSSSAPYINSLAQQGALFTNSYAISHPSQPNYLDFFSGSNQGITNDNCPYNFSAANLGSELLAGGYTFTGYSEDLPAPGSTVCSSGGYLRRHSPWVSFTNVPPADNLPSTYFPSDYTTLPAVSMLIPNVYNDMHNGTVAQGDTWLQAHVDGYVQWAKTHNSLLILTWDEDDGSAGNHIPTIFSGEMVTVGQYSEYINHFNILRTLEDMYNLPYAGQSGSYQPITDIWATSGGTATITPTPTATFTPSSTPTLSPSATPTLTATSTSSPTTTATASPTLTDTPTSTETTAATLTSTPTSTPTACMIAFSDVSATDYFYEAVRYLYCHAAISGYSDGTFRPYNNTTRGQLSKIVVLAQGWPLLDPSTPTFSDVPRSDPFFTYVETAYDRGIISGYSDGTFRPQNSVTRAQLCKIIVLAEGWPPQSPPNPTFTDVPADHPFYEYIETAYGRGIISGYADGSFRPGNNATRGQICKILYNALIPLQRAGQGNTERAYFLFRESPAP